MANEVLIQVDNDYEIMIDGNKDHEARENLHKIYTNPKTGVEIPQYRSIGHYSNVPNALDSISRDMAIRKANKKGTVTIAEYSRIIRESNEYMMDIIREKFADLL